MRILCVNTGSSSVKLALWDGARALHRIQAESLRGAAQFDAAVTSSLRALPATPDAIAHRIVAADTAWPGARRLDAALLQELAMLAPLAPDHLPQALAAIRAAQAALPALPQVACSDSSFHRTLPDVARQIALPRELCQRGLARYGYHGLSCESVLAVLRAEGALPGRLIIAHLGNGCSLTAVRDGQSVETTMGFTPLGGLVMSTRSGDLDPGVLLYLLRAAGYTPDALNALLNHEAGLKGVSGSSGDMKVLLADARPEAQLAVDLFVHQARKHLGALAAVLGGVDLVVFTGGIGENAATIRERICAGMDWLAPHRSLSVRVIPANEELVMARQAAVVLGSP